jgi:hypothetical protein
MDAKIIYCTAKNQNLILMADTNKQPAVPKIPPADDIEEKPVYIKFKTLVKVGVAVGIFAVYITIRAEMALYKVGQLDDKLPNYPTFTEVKNMFLEKENNDLIKAADSSHKK